MGTRCLLRCAVDESMAMDIDAAAEALVYDSLACRDLRIQSYRMAYLAYAVCHMKSASKTVIKSSICLHEMDLSNLFGVLPDDIGSVHR